MLQKVFENRKQLVYVLQPAWWGQTNRGGRAGLADGVHHGGGEEVVQQGGEQKAVVVHQLGQVHVPQHLQQHLGLPERGGTEGEGVASRVSWAPICLFRYRFERAGLCQWKKWNAV